MTKKTPIMKRILCMLLAVSILAAYVPAMAAAADADQTVITKVSDPATVNNWKNHFSMTSTANAGGVWTDKSVFTSTQDYLDATDEAEDAAAQAGLALLHKNNFLIALSAIASTKSIEGYSNIPTDTILILDVSGSMEDSGSDDDMVHAANRAIHTLLSLNKHNRVGVVLYSGSTQGAASNTALLLLPLDRYTAGDTYTVGYGSNATTYQEYLKFNNHTVIIGDRLKDSNGNTVTSNSRKVVGATYIQSGLNVAMNEFLAADTVITGDVFQAGTVRMPVTVLMTDGDPTIGTTKYTNTGSSYEFGSGSNSSDELGFVTQMSAAYLKAKVEEHYNNGSLFYTLGLGVGNGSVAESVLDPEKSNATINGYWNEFLADGTADWVTGGGYNQTTRTVSRPANDTIALADYANYKHYVTEYFPARNASNLNNAFQSIVDAITLQSMYYPTHVEGSDFDSGGFIEFRDYIGNGMEVKAVKGVQWGNVLHTGKDFAYTVKYNMGTVTNPTDEGNELVWAVMDRLGIEDVVTARALISDAWTHGQLAYNDTDPNNITYSNYIGVYLDSNGKYLGFWDGAKESLTNAPANAFQAVKCYYMLGDVADGHRATDMLYASIQVRTTISTGEQIVYGRLPASLIPLIQHTVTLDSDSPSTATSATLTTTATTPSRLIYEVGLDSAIAIETLAPGTHTYFTNQWETEIQNGADPSTAHNTFVSFQPSEENERYVYHEDMPIYVKSGSSYIRYTGSTAPSGDGYYRAYAVYTATGNGNEATITINYEPIPSQALSSSSVAMSEDESYWIVKKGTVYRYETRAEVAKTSNPTGTLDHSEHPLVHTSPAYHLDAVLGNNGKLTLVVVPPKTVTDASGNDIDGKAVIIGSKLTYTISATNYEDTASTIVITDKVPTGTALVDGSISANGVHSGGNLTWTFPNVDPNETVTAVFTVVVTGESMEVIENQATIQIGTNDPYVTNTTKNYPTGKISIAPDASGNVKVGDEITYTIHYHNDTDGAAEVVITDIIPAGTTYVAGSATYSGNSAVLTETTDSNNTVTGLTWKLSSVPSGASGTVSFRVVVNASAETKIENNATITIGTNKPSTTTTVNSLITGNLVLSKTVATGNAAGNTNKEFTLVLTGPAELNGTYTVENGNDSSITFVNGKAELAIKHGQNILIKGLPTGTVIGVYEQLAPGYTPSYSQDVVTIGAGTATAVRIDVENIYHVSPTSLVLQAAKALTGRTLLERRYEFNITDTTDNSPTKGMVVATGSNTAPAIGNTGAITFTPISFSAAGIYTYEISEVVGSESGVTYDTEKYTVIVTVADDGAGKLYVDEVKVGTTVVTVTNGTADTGITFENTYTPDDLLLHLYGNKTVTVMPGAAYTMQGNDFTFVVFDSSTNEVVSTGTNDANGLITFNPIEYNFADMSGATVVGHTYSKVFTYKVAEIIPDVALDKYMDYSDTVYTIEVTVTYDAVNATWSYVVKDSTDAEIANSTNNSNNTSEKLNFVNTKHPSSIAVPVYINKTTTGSNIPGNAHFSISVYDKNGNEVAAGAVPANTGSIAAFVANLYFTDAGTYEFTVKETKAGTTGNGITYDSDIYTMTVVVTLTDGKLSAVATYQDAANNTVSNPSFENAYNANGQFTLVLNKNDKEGKNLSGRDPVAGEFLFEIKDENGKVVSTGTNDKDGNITFGSIYYTESSVVFDSNDKAVLTYYVYEVKGSEPGVSYDDTIYTIEVTLTHDNSGNITTSYKVVKIDDTVASDGTKITFNNSYAPVTGTSITINGNKVLTGRDLREGEFAFRMYHVDGATETLVESATNLDLDGDGVFDDFSFTRIYPASTKPGTYTYKIVEVKGNTPGVSYTEKSYYFTVTITDNQDGTLSASITYGGQNVGSTLSGLAFTNNYAPTATEYIPDVDKVLNGRDMADGEFSFVVLDGTTQVSSGSSVQAVSGTKSQISFSPIVLSAVGTYTFEIKENSGSLGGVKYDSKSIYLVVVVVDNTATGKLEVASYDYYSDAALTTKLTDPGFENTYTTEPVGVKLSGNKDLIGKDLLAGEFKFVIEGHGVTIYTTNDVEGNINFPTLVFSKPGTYTYTVKEAGLGDSAVDSTVGTYDMDETVYTVVITVEDDGNGKLYATYRYYKNYGDPTVTEVSAANFTNTYTAAPVELDLNTSIDVDKTVEDLSGDANYSPAGFTFDVFNWAGEKVATGTSDAAGNVTFDKALTFNVADEYYFRIVEADSGKAGIIHDETEWVLHVTVTYDHTTGKLVIGAVDIFELTPNAQADIGGNPSGQANTEIDFVNTYDPTDVDVHITMLKKLTGRDLKEGEFLFEILDDKGNAVASAHNDADGNILFTLTFDKTGTYTYTVKEVSFGAGGITYDPAEYEITVVVSNDTANGKLVATVTDNYDGETITFQNTYKTTPATITLGAHKELEGRPLDTAEFEFILEDADGNTYPATNTANGKVTFESIELNKPGTYTYKVYEKEGNLPGITYSDVIYTAIVEVVDNGIGALVATVTYTYEDENGATKNIDLPLFHNVYKATPVSVILEATKALSGRDLVKGEFEFVLTDADGNDYTAKNAADGSIVFDAIEFTNVGTYTFTLTETKGTKGGVTYDETSYKVEVVVTDNTEKGILEATVTVDGKVVKPNDAGTYDLATFNNSYKAASVVVDYLEALKVLVGRTLTAGEFEFVLTDKDGKVVSSGKNDADGKILFSKIEYTSAGVYTYTLSESKGNDANVTYDETDYEVTVIVKDNGEGKLVVDSVSVNKVQLKDGSNVLATFTNTYTEPEKQPEPTPPAPGPSYPVDPDDTKPPYTGDAFSMSLLLTLLFISGGAISCLMLPHVRKRIRQ